jgi:urocanate hydratase
MLLNSLDPEVAERPQELFISGAAGKAAADWESFHSIVASLRRVGGDESLRVESGRAAGVTRSTAHSPRVIATNAEGGEDFGNWLYAGTQSALPVLDELYGAAARRHFGGTLAGKLVVGGGMGGAGGAQPLAAALHGAAFLGVDADAERIKRRVKGGYCEVLVTSLDEALRMLKNAVRQRKSASVGLLGNCAELFPELARRGVVPDLLTDYTPATPPFGGYILAASQSAQESAAAQLQGRRELEKLGTRVMDAVKAQEYLQPLLGEGWRLTTWLALSGERGDIARLDRLTLERFPRDERIQRWLAITSKYIRFQGLPARVSWLKRRDLGEFARAVNDLVARGEISAPVLLGCHDTASAPISEHGACWTWSSSAASAQTSLHAASAQAFVADGTADAAARLSRWTGA